MIAKKKYTLKHTKFIFLLLQIGHFWQLRQLIRPLPLLLDPEMNS